MFHKIIKRGRKGSKNDDSGFGAQSPGSRGSGTVSTSNVVVNHASRVGPAAAPTPAPQPSAAAALPAAPPPGTIESLPGFKDVAPQDRHSLFHRKVQNCFYVFDFSDSMKGVREKEIKRQTLLELIEFIHSGPGKIPENLQEEMIKMVSVNIFRCLPPSARENSVLEATDPEEEEPYLEPSWPHLQLAYELLLRYVVSHDTDIKIAKRYVDHTFVLKLLDMFDSEDPREREYLKTIVHRIYGKFMVHRPFIRKAISNIFYRYIYEKERYSGMCELLEILGSIINGFALPMKEEHRRFLVRALIPLHKPKSIGVYHQHLCYCITQFVEKDFRLADIVLRGLLKYWPVTNCQKELLFLEELEQILEATQPAEFQRCINPLFKQIACCLRSPHFQVELQKVGVWQGLSLTSLEPGVSSATTSMFLGTRVWFVAIQPFSDPAISGMYRVAEKAFLYWNNEHIVDLIAQNRGRVLPIIFEALEKNMQSHWNPAIHGLTSNVQKMFHEMDIELYEQCHRQYEEKMARSKEQEEQRALAWKKVDEAAGKVMIAA